MNCDSDRLIELFDQARQQPSPAGRTRFLDGVCLGDPELRSQIELLLRAHDEAGAFLQNAAGAASPAALQEGPGDRIGRYKLLQKIGEGGCGVVYMAEQEEPVRRKVAVKVIKLGMDTRSVIARFEAEQQALALMDHPNIAKIFDAGATATGRPFFVMELVRGVKITDYCDRNNLSTGERLALFTQVCHAIQHAHQKGVIHRDLKPSNVLVTVNDGVPVPTVIDFGIAKATEQKLTHKTLFTAFEQFLGTPAYMSPEQAVMTSVDIDTRSDIYSLGVLLYELLTGRTPFDTQALLRAGLDEVRRTIREVEPLRPSTCITALGDAELTVIAGQRRSESAKLATLIRGDLDWIVMKCLEKDRSRRYATANDLATDLQRHLTHEPVVARPPSLAYRFQKWARRNQLIVAATGAVVAALLVGLFLALGQAIRATRAEQEIRRNAYAAEISVAFRVLAENDLGRARELLDRQRPKPGDKTDLRGFEWRHLWQLCQGDETATFHDAGAQAAAFSPDGKLFAYSDWGPPIVVREVASHRVVTNLPGAATTLSFAPHTNLMASGHESGVTIWNTETWARLLSLPDTLMPSLFSPDGRWLLTGVPNGFRVWDVQTWQPVGLCPGAPLLSWQARNAVAFSPDGQFLVTVAGEKQIGDHLRVWRLPGMERLPDVPLRIEDDEHPASVAFSADGKHLIVGLWNSELVVYEFATRQIITPPLKEHTAWVTAIAVAPDGRTLVTSSADRTVNVWDATTFKLLSRLRGHTNEVWGVALSPDGGIAASGGRGNVTKLWSTGTRHTDPVLEGFNQVAGFTARDRNLVAATSEGWCVWTPENGARAVFPVPTNPPVVTWGKPYAVKPDEPLGALGRTNGTIEIWDLTTGANVAAWPAHQDAVSAVAFSPDGKRLATGTVKGDVKIWDFDARREIGRLGPMDCQLFCLAFSRDGKTLAASGNSSLVRLWDAATGRKVRQLDGHLNIVAGLAFSPDGTLLATTSFNNEARLWELPSGRELPPLRGHLQAVTGVAFAPDGKTLATCGMDGKVKLWHTSTGQELATFSIRFEFPALSFSPDGRMLAVGDLSGVNRRIRMVRAPSFEDIAAAEAKRDQAEIPAR